MGGVKTQSLVDLSDDELLALAESDEQIVRHDSESDVQSFLIRFDISSGAEQVNPLSVFRFYKAWSERPVLKSQFMDELGVLLNQPTDQFLQLNKTPFELVVKKKPKRQLNLINYYKFIQDEKITQGPIQVHVEATRRLYNKWAAKNKIVKASQKTFLVAISKFLPIQTFDRGRYVLVDKETGKKLVELVHEEQKEEAKKQKRKS